MAEAPQIQHHAKCFAALDRDGNGNVSLDEIILTVTEFGHERKSIATSMHDLDQATDVLDELLETVVFIVCIFVFSKHYQSVIFLDWIGVDLTPKSTPEPFCASQIQKLHGAPM